MVEVAVLGDDVVGSGGDGAVHELVVIRRIVFIGLFVGRAQMLTAQLV